MSYEVLNSKGERITIVYDGTLNKDTSLDIVGTNYSGYGPVIAKNFIKVLNTAIQFYEQQEEYDECSKLVRLKERVNESEKGNKTGN